MKKLGNHIGVSENRLNPEKPNGFADHYPYEKWLAIIGNIPNIFRQTHIGSLSISLLLSGFALNFVEIPTELDS